MQFTNSKAPLSQSQIDEIEYEFGFRLPQPARDTYLRSNGGEPAPYIFHSEKIDTIVAEFLPLISELEGTAVQAYARLVVQKGIVPLHFFPFAVDGGGDYFFVNCQTSDGQVYFFRGDTAFDSLLPLNLDFEAFWKTLIPE